MRILTITFAGLMLTGCATAQPAEPLADPSTSAMQEAPPHSPAPAPSTRIVPTRILDAAAADMLKNNSGLTLQWISWDRRGDARVTEDDRGVWLLAGRQSGRGDIAPGMLSLEGTISEIGKDYFLFDGRIAITNTPDAGRQCLENRRDWRFAVTQNRKYWRLRTFEWCDDLTDYIDIYF